MMPMDPNAGGAAGLALLKQIQSLQKPGQGLAPDAGGMPNFIDNGMIGKIMQGNPGGLLGAILNKQGGAPPVNPGAPPAAGNPAAPPDGQQSPMQGGSPLSGILGGGLLSKMPFGMLAGLLGGK